MPKEHIVNKKDGLNSLWKIAKHYNVSFQELKQKNSHLKDRDPAYWINIGDKVILPEKQSPNKKLGECVLRCIQNAMPRFEDDVNKKVVPTSVASGKKLLVKKVEGPDTSKTGKTVKYTAIEFNKPDPDDAEKRGINWIIKDNDDKEIKKFHAHGAVLKYKIPSSLRGRTIRIMPYIKSPTPDVSVITKIICPFEALCNLEKAAIADGYTLKQRVTAFRKLYYDSTAPVKTFLGLVTGGGRWNILIPGASKTKIPKSWKSPKPELQKDKDYMKTHKIIKIGGEDVDIGHLFAGADAANYLTDLKLLGVSMRSNHEATTFVGDLGSIVVEYLHGSKKSFYDTAMKKSDLLYQYYDGKYGRIKPEDMAGNADSYSLKFASGKTICESMKEYYAEGTGTYRKRFTRFAKAIGFKDKSSTWKTKLREQVFNAALAYAAASGHKGDVINVLSKPGPGFFAPTFREAYWNISGWVVDIFVSRMKDAIAKE